MKRMSKYWREGRPLHLIWAASGQRRISLLRDIEQRLRKASAIPAKIILCADGYVAGLNRRFRNRRGTTDVLAFPYGPSFRIPYGERAPLKTPYSSFRRKPESSSFKGLWIPTFACPVDSGESRNDTHGVGMTFLEVPEIYIAVGVALRQARSRNVSLKQEILRLSVHGLAHLAGYDHHTPGDFRAMRQKEFETLVQIL